jgi:hypothetical protein
MPSTSAKRGPDGRGECLAEQDFVRVLGILSILFVALNEKKGTVATARGYSARVNWE